MRRLPIYFLIDVSESKVGESIMQVENGLRNIIQDLRTDSLAFETIFISVITSTNVITPLTPLDSFKIPVITIGEQPSIDIVIENLFKEIDKSIIKTTPEQKGDWRPSVMIFTNRMFNPDQLRTLLEPLHLNCNIYAEKVFSSILIINSSWEKKIGTFPKIRIDIPHAVAVGQEYDCVVKDINVLKI